MRQAILITVFIAATYPSFSRNDQVHQNPTAPIADSIIISPGLPDTHGMLSEIMSVVGLAPNFELKEAKVSNIEASISHRKRYILYNPEFINWISNATKDKWAAITLLAHEVGHHLNGHTIRKSGSTPALELEADEFAGFVLHKLGASLEQAQEVMKHIAKTKASRTHPARTSRMLAIQTGWNKAANAESISVAAKK